MAIYCVLTHVESSLDSNTSLVAYQFDSHFNISSFMEIRRSWIISVTHWKRNLDSKRKIWMRWDDLRVSHKQAAISKAVYWSHGLKDLSHINSVSLCVSVCCASKLILIRCPSLNGQESSVQSPWRKFFGARKATLRAQNLPVRSRTFHNLIGLIKKASHEG